MSTDHQRYSTQNQADVIAAYATRRNFEIVHRYADEGRSGLDIAGRNGLRALLADVQSGNADFEAVLVYDISRWGRFQDADESAYYEFICRERGIEVHYCAEQFDNDGSLSSNVMKNIKRVMAGEYSRELSSKVFAGHCRMVTLGYHQGGPAGYGLRRVLVDSDNKPKFVLERGQYKNLATDRIILAPGPEHEVENIRRIYRLFIEDRRDESEIASILNGEGQYPAPGRLWTSRSVRQVLTHEKYAGTNVYNRLSFKLRRKRVANSPDMWVRAPGAFKPLVDPGTFKAAQAIIADRARPLSDEELLDKLAQLLEKRGALSGAIIDAMEGMPSTGSYKRRFGSLVQAYQRIGYKPARDLRFIATNRQLRLKHPDIVEAIVSGIQAVGGHVTTDPVTNLMLVNHEVTLAIIIARCRTAKSGLDRWQIRPKAGLRPDITVVVRYAADNASVRDYYLFPRLDLGARTKIELGEDNGALMDAYRAKDLSPLFQLFRRYPLDRCA